jgi:hypothetical protein
MGLKMTTQSLNFPRKFLLIPLGVVVLVALAIRLSSINYGLPHIYHMEEPYYSEAAWGLACQSNLNSSLLQPQTFMFALSVFSIDRFQVTEACSAVEQEKNQSVILAGRLVSVATGTLAVLVIFQLGTVLFDAPVGLLSAVFLALNFLHARESQHATPDVTTTMFIAAALLSYVPIARGKITYPRYLIAGILTVFAITGRPTSVLLMLPFAYAHFAGQGVWKDRTRQNIIRALVSPKVAFTGTVMVITLVFLSPQILVSPIDYLRYWRSFLGRGSGGGFGRIQVDPLPAPLFYLRAIEWGAGLLLALVMGAGVIWAIRRRTLGDILLVSFIIPYFILASITGVYFARYIIPILPLIGLLAARLLWEIVPQGRRLLWVGGAAAILLIQPVERIARYTHIQAQTDTRTIASYWIAENIPPGSKLALEWHTPAVDDRVYEYNTVDFYGLSVHDLEKYVEEGYEYLIVSSFIRDVVLLRPDADSEKRAFYQQLAEQAELIYELTPYTTQEAPPYKIDQVLGPITSLDQMERPGPIIQIYHLTRDT